MKLAAVFQKYRIHAVFIISVILLYIIMPKVARFNYDYKKGSVWKYETLVAQFDFPIYKTEEQIRQERDDAQSIIIPYYKYSEDIVNHSIKTADALSLDDCSAVKPILISALRDIYSHGVISNEIKYSRKSNLSTDLLYIQKDKRAVKCPVSEVYKQSDASALLVARLTSSFPKIKIDSVFKANGIYELIVPNLIFDEQTTDLIQSEIDKDISPTQGYVKAGQLIVSKDEIVTSEIEHILNSYKQEYNSNMGYSDYSILTALGRIIISVLLILLIFFVIYLVEPGIFEISNKVHYIVFIFFLVAIPSLYVGRNDDTFIFIVPFTLGILYLRTFFKFSTIVPLYAISLLPLMIFRQNGPLLFTIYLFAGLASSAFFKYGYRGWKQFIPSFVTFIILVINYYGFKMLGFFNDPDGNTILYMFIGSFFAGAAYPLAYIFERVFKLLSSTSLNELTDSDNAMVRDLEEKAPGTFQHCLQVMSMAEAVGRSVDANLPLLRAGALYHDIGKTMNPLCFVENSTIASTDGEEKSPSYHASLSPQESAAAITRHVTDGLVLAGRYHLPEPVSDFILTHHGTSRVGFFYNKYVNEGGDPSNTIPFTYQGKKPQTKEQVIVMICDSIEAASRTLKDNSVKAYSDFVENMVASKIADGQLDEANISFKDIYTIKESLKSYLAQMNHERVAYPKRKKIRNQLKIN